MVFLPSSRLARPAYVVTVLAAAVAALPAAQAAEPFVIKDIRIEGLQRTDPGTVFAALPFRVGDTYSDDKSAAALRSLFATGLFKDVRLEIDGAVVVVVIDERPVIQTVTFVGLKEFDKDTLLKSLKDAGIGEGLSFDRALVDRAEQEIKRQYLSRSLYGAEVVTTISPAERNRVNVTFTMNEGDAARIREVRIVGAKVFSESTLRGLMEMSASGWLSWYSKNDRYSRSKLNADLEAIRSHYLNRGYLEFAITSTQVTISPDKQEITITITVTEGQPFVVTGVKLQGEFLGKEDEFRQLVTIRPGQPYRAEDVAETTKRIGDRFGVYGYAFARIEPVPEVDRASGQVVLTLRAEPQRRVYVRRIDVAGNTRTRDEVVRREFRQLESAWYDGQRIKLSRDRVDRLGYFKDVAVETTEVPDSPDQVDLTINVTEKPTGNISLGMTFSSTEKLALSAAIRQDNVFGSGNYLGLEVNTSKTSRNLVFSTVDPYFTNDGISRAIDLFYRTTRPLNSVGETYRVATPGGSIRFGVPFSEIDTVYFGVGLERTEFKAGRSLPSAYAFYRNEFGQTSTSVPLTLGWSRDERDSLLTPTTGRYQRVNLEWSAAGDVRYLRTNLQFQQYLPLFSSLTLGLNAELGWGKGLNGKSYPVFKNFYGGGLGSVRVFEQGSLGWIDPAGAYLGGTKRLNLNAELYFPVPGTGNDKSLRIFAFADAGNVWRDEVTPTLDSLRASAGLGLSWLSPVGPLKLSWGQPLRSQRNDRIQKFQFQIGTAF
ncbi:outer membrane protein assembly complex, YaeT protein [Burkholderiales bacterium JOSHI_001]|nr:outer membrane protein assembly complex, YaeT protein [Burkholderiales bacterium JOSHI_001]